MNRLLLLLAFALGLGQAYAQTTSHVAQLNALADKAQAHGTVRVIVGLQPNTSMAASGTAGNAPKLKVDDVLKGRAAEAQNRFLVQLDAAARAAGVLTLPVHQQYAIRTFPYSPHVALTVTPADLAMLKKMTGLTTIEEDLVLEPSLSASVPLVGASGTNALVSPDGQGFAVAVLDTGVDKAHPFLSGKVIAEACFSGAGSTTSSLCPNHQTQQIGTDAGVNCALDVCKHGTHVAGIAAGKSGSALAARGVANNANVIAVQVFTSTSTSVGAYNSDIIAGLQHVYSLRTSINIASVNMSLGNLQQSNTNCDTTSPAMKDAIDLLRSANIVTVIASGNSGYTNGISFPACISSAVAVGSTSKTDAIESYSNSAANLKLLAPGGLIQSSVPNALYASLSGTSMATPHVAGALATLRSAYPDANAEQLVTALQQSNTQITDSRNGITKPRLYLPTALTYLKNLPAPVIPPVPTQIAPTGIITTTTPTYSWNASAGAASYWLFVGNGSGTLMIQNYTAAGAGCGTGTGICSVTPATAAANDTPYIWAVLASNATGDSAWSSGNIFMASTSVPPPAPTLITPTGTITTQQPTYSWNASAGAASYLLWVGNGSGAVTNQVYTATALGCGSGTGICSVTPAATLGNGTSYGWAVAANNNAGNSPWSNWNVFTVNMSTPPVAQ